MIFLFPTHSLSLNMYKLHKSYLSIETEYFELFSFREIDPIMHIKVGQIHHHNTHLFVDSYLEMLILSKILQEIDLPPHSAVAKSSLIIYLLWVSIRKLVVRRASRLHAQTNSLGSFWCQGADSTLTASEKTECLTMSLRVSLDTF